MSLMNSLFPLMHKLDPKCYNVVFYKNVCHVCKGVENLKNCSQCKTIAYCSKMHQKTDWPLHKEFCKAMSKTVDKFKGFKTTNFEEFMQMKKYRLAFLNKVLGRDMTFLETVMYLNKKYCEVCFSENTQVECLQCKNVFFCSGDHRSAFKESHTNCCNEFRIVREMEISLLHETVEFDIRILNIPNQIQMMPSNIFEFTKLCDKNSENRDFSLSKNLLKLTWLSPVASILYGLEKCGFLNNRTIKKTELNVHIVGAISTYEETFLWKEICEIFFHWINDLIKLEFFNVGPELISGGTRGDFTKKMCKNCQKKNVVSSCTFLPGFYHDKVKDLATPDIIVCFNSGINVQSSGWQNWAGNTWMNSIKYLIGNRAVPLILTDYTFDEITRDISEIMKFSKNEVKVLVEPHPNPFHCLKPDVYLEKQVPPIVHRNEYICVLQKN